MAETDGMEWSVWVCGADAAVLGRSLPPAGGWRPGPALAGAPGAMAANWGCSAVVDPAAAVVWIAAAGAGDDDGGWRKEPLPSGGVDGISIDEGGRWSAGALAVPGVQIRDDGSVWTHGSNTHGQLGHGDVVARDAPTRVDSLWEIGARIAAVARGNWHTLFLTTDGDVYACGVNLDDRGQTGVTGNVSALIPNLVELPSDDPIAEVGAGSAHSIALARSGALYGWGWNAYGQLAHEPTHAIEPVLLPLPPPCSRGGRVRAIACGRWHTIAIVAAPAAAAADYGQ